MNTNKHNKTRGSSLVARRSDSESQVTRHESQGASHGWKPVFRIFLPFIASALMLSVIQAPINLSFFAWVAFVPFIAASSEIYPISSRRMFFIVYIVSFFYWSVNLYWIYPITIAGGLVLCLYLALLWPLLYFCLRFCVKKKVPLFLASAILIVGIERMQGIFLGGFFWRFLAHSQYQNTTIIQIADIFGAGGVSFLIAMVNGMIADLVIFIRLKIYKEQHGLKPILLVAKTSVVCLAVLAAVFYGRWRIGQEAEFVKDGPLAASLQSNVPQSVKRSFESSDDLFNSLMKDSNEASAYKPELIVWPETMVQGILNPEVLAYREDTHESVIFDKELREYAKKNNAYLLVGAYGGSTEITKEKDVILGGMFNSAFFYTKDGKKAPEVYDKIHLVPFGEVLPLRKSMAWFYNLLMKVKFIPYNFDYSLDYGSNYTIFNMTGNEGQKYKFSVIICYEDTVPVLPRRFALDENGKKRIDWLVNISNDGWFVRWGKEKVMPSTELPQHAAVCVFRAVENRLPVLRSVNTGVSCLIDSSGRIKNGFVAGTLPQNALERTGMSGWFADRIPIDTRTAFFSKYGEWLDYFCEFCVFFVIFVSLSGRFIRFKKG